MATEAARFATPDVFPSRRSPVFGRRGMVASTQPLASEAGLRILREGGNAADAAVAMAAALNVTEPYSTGLGGDAFALFYDSTTRSVRCAMGNGRSPASMTMSALRERGVEGQRLPPLDALCVTVPGSAACWDEVVGQWGRLPLDQVLQPAIQLAEGGWPVGPVTSAQWSSGMPQVVKAGGPGVSALQNPEGRAPRPGQMMSNPDLAAVLRRLAAQGALEGFYRGATADAIIHAVSTRGGLLTHADLQAHRTSFVDPISTTYRGVRVYEVPPPTQGIAALLALNLLEASGQNPPPPASTDAPGSTPPTPPPGGGPGWQSAARFHAMVEAMRMAFADSFAFNADPEHVPVPVGPLLDKAYAQQRWTQGFYSDKAGEVRPGHPSRDGPGASPGSSAQPDPEAQDTVYFCAVDGDGNACSFINSIYKNFGSGIVPEGCGFALHNRGNNFILQEGHPNCVAGGKRPYHTIIPGLATHESSGELYAAFGVMGGFMQPQGQMQVLSNMVDHGLDPQSALDAPRFLITGVDSNSGPGCVATSSVLLEHGIDESVASALEAMGHRVQRSGGRVMDRDSFGKGQIIRRDAATGVLWGGSDPRGDGLAIGF